MYQAPMHRRTLRWRSRRRGRLLLLGAVILVGVFGYLHTRAPHKSPAPPPIAVGSHPAPSSTRPAPSSSPTTAPSSTPQTTALPASYLIKVPAQSQFPQLPNGCEITTLSMLLSGVGHPVDKMTLAAEMPKDPTPLQLQTITGANGSVIHKVTYWGNPNVGFVGSVYQSGDGYGIYHGPMIRLLNQILPDQAEDLTGKPFTDLLAQVARGVPVEVWTTLDFTPTTNWVTWNSPEGPVHATPLEHAVLLVGYNQNDLFVNNPWTGQAAEQVAKAPFIAAWKQLGEQAISVQPKPSPT